MLYRWLGKKEIGYKVWCTGHKVGQIVHMGSSVIHNGKYSST